MMAYDLISGSDAGLWAEVVKTTPSIRKGIFFTTIRLLDRTGCRHDDGKGLNRHDYRAARDEMLPGAILWMGAGELREWARRLLKYRQQLHGIGIEYPENLGCM